MGGYPLALVLTAAQLADRTETVGGILGRVRAAMPEALAYARAASLPERHRSVGAALKSSFDRLSPAARLLAARVALLPGGASEELLEALEGGPGWRPAAEELRHGQLARWAEGRYTMLPPIRAAAEGLAPAEEQAAWRLRAAGYLRDYAYLYRQGLDTAGQTQAYRELKALIERAGVDAAARAQLDQMPAELVDHFGIAGAGRDRGRGDGRGAGCPGRHGGRAGQPERGGPLGGRGGGA